MRGDAIAYPLPLIKLCAAIPALVAALCLWGASAALAGEPTNFVRSVMDRVLAIQNDPALSGAAQEPARARAIRQVIKKSFDFKEMARNSLGPAYDRLAAGQRQEFTEVFSYLFLDSYTRMVLNFLKKETVQYKREQLQDGQARVDTALVRTNETIPVDYLMRRQSQNWLLYDVIVDGVSILDNYKSQFAQIIQTKSFDFLLQKMKTQYRAVK